MDTFPDKIQNYISKVVNLQDNSEGSAIPEQLSYYYTLLKTYPHIKRIVEIGFNAGLSAAAFLASRDDISVISFDICSHDYVINIKREIDKHFPGRHTLIIGDSKEALPMLNKFFSIESNPVDLFFVDGDHRDPMPLIDIENALKWLSPNSLLIVDDMCELHGNQGVNQAIDKCIKDGKLTILDHRLARDRGWGVFHKGPNA